MEDVINKEYCLYFAKTYSIGYKELANTFIGLNIEKKLIHLFPTISENKYMLDMKNEMVKYTLKVFRLRNKLIHQPNELIPVYLNQVSKGIFIETPIDNESNKKMNSLTDEWPDINKKDLMKIQKILNQFLPFINYVGTKINNKQFNYRKFLKKVKEVS